MSIKDQPASFADHDVTSPFSRPAFCRVLDPTSRSVQPYIPNITSGGVSRIFNPPPYTNVLMLTKRHDTDQIGRFRDWATNHCLVQIPTRQTRNLYRTQEPLKCLISNLKSVFRQLFRKTRFKWSICPNL